MFPFRAACKTSATRGKPHAVFHMLCVSVPSAYSGSGMRSITLLASELRDGTRDSVFPAPLARAHWLALKTTLAVHSYTHIADALAFRGRSLVLRKAQRIIAFLVLKSHAVLRLCRSFVIHHSSFVIAPWQSCGYAVHSSFVTRFTAA